MNRPIFQSVYESLDTHPQIKSVKDGGVEEMNKIQVQGYVGGCYRKRFHIEPTDDATLDNFGLRNAIEKDNDKLLTANDKPKAVNKRQDRWFW
jgi:hypothetical protein